MDRPRARIIPEWFGGGTLPRKELHVAKVTKHFVNATADEITDELRAALKS